MGMDVSGINADTKVGEYFRANCWSWRPIMCVMDLAGALDLLPNHTVTHMNYNDGAGARSKKQAVAMAAVVDLWIQEQDWAYSAEQKEYYWEPDWKDSMIEENGVKRSMYRVYKPHLEAWVTFLQNCGDGFEVW